MLHLQSEREREDVRACVEGICARLPSSYKTQPHPSLHVSRDIDAAGTLAWAIGSKSLRMLKQVWTC